VVSFVSKYVPSCFKDVFGQDPAVLLLSRLVLGEKKGMSILLHGSVGSGKTTLARIYGKALNCDETREPPCNKCKSCMGLDDETKFHEIDCPSIRDLEGLREFLQSARPPSPGRWRVLFFDEAHALKALPGAFDLLLKTVEEPPERVIFCFATTEFNNIPPALRSRVFPVKIRQLNAALAIAFLSDVARKEQILPTPEPEALALIAGLADGQPRDLLQRLDQVQRDGDVTVARVRAVFGVDHTSELIEYFMSLASGDQGEQTRKMSEWREEVATKLRLVQLFLLALYYNQILKLSVIVDPLIHSIPAQDRQYIVEGFRTRLEPVGVELNAFWRGMIALLPPVTSNQSDATLLLQLALFHHFVCRPGAPAPSVPTREIRGSGVECWPSRTRRKHEAAILRKPRRPNVEHDLERLTFAQVAALVNAASHCVQAYSQLFNARITIWHRAFGCGDAAGAASSMSEISRKLGNILTLRPPVPYLRLAVQEHDDQAGFCARMIVHVPDDEIERVESWLREQSLEAGTPEGGYEAVEFKPCDLQPPLGAKRVAFHWECVRWLCAGVNAKELGWDPKTKRWQNLLKLLKVTKGRKAGNIGGRKRWSASYALSKGLEEWADYKMPFLSAFDDGEWGRIRDGWELDEYEVRRRLRADRAAEIALVESKFPRGHNDRIDAERQSELDRVIMNWSDDPTEWERGRPVWWETPEI
jgi:DNA polymerase-3 subunit gamma/tau